MSSIPVPDFIDSHMHLFDLGHPTLQYEWLTPDFVHPVIGDIDAIKSRKYDVTAFEGETRFSSLVGAVHVQAALGSKDPVEETIWLDKQADSWNLPMVFVGDARLQDPNVAETLERQAAFGRMRGIRDFAQGDYLVDPDFERGYAMLETYDLLYDLDCYHENMHKAAALAARHPNTPMVLGHAGFPQQRTDQYFAAWSEGMATLASVDNVTCKISGLGMVDQRWTVDSLRRWVLTAIETFGVERCMFATNWPVDRLFSSYCDLVAAYGEIVADFSQSERAALFADNARRVYGFQ